MINVLINGANGKMGQEVANQIKLNGEFSVMAGIDKNTESNDFGVFDDINKISKLPDVIIDFSVPQASLNALNFASKNKVPIVIATTGFSDDEINIIKKHSKIIPIFKSANMSYEINLMADLVAKLAIKLKDSDIEIIDTHHKNKIDSPSGTSLLLADSINIALNNEMVYEYNRHLKREKRNENEIGIHSIRGGTEVGKHTVLFLGDNESFEITHTVASRKVFAKGSLRAAKFLIAQTTPGLYTMQNLI